MATFNNEKPVFLASSEDWELWNLQFQAQAVAGGLWSQVQGVTPFLTEPSAPNPTHHRHKTPSQSTVIVRGSSASVAGDDDSGQASRLFTIADLTADGFRTYQLERTIYEDDKKDYT